MSFLSLTKCRGQCWFESRPSRLLVYVVLTAQHKRGNVISLLYIPCTISLQHLNTVLQFAQRLGISSVANDTKDNVHYIKWHSEIVRHCPYCVFIGNKSENGTIEIRYCLDYSFIRLLVLTFCILISMFFFVLYAVLIL